MSKKQSTTNRQQSTTTTTTTTTKQQSTTMEVGGITCVFHSMEERRAYVAAAFPHSKWGRKVAKAKAASRAAALAAMEAVVEKVEEEVATPGSTLRWVSSEELQTLQNFFGGGKPKGKRHPKRRLAVKQPTSYLYEEAEADAQQDLVELEEELAQREEMEKLFPAEKAEFFRRAFNCLREELFKYHIGDEEFSYVEENLYMAVMAQPRRVYSQIKYGFIDNPSALIWQEIDQSFDLNDWLLDHQGLVEASKDLDIPLVTLMKDIRQIGCHWSRIQSFISLEDDSRSIVTFYRLIVELRVDIGKPPEDFSVEQAEKLLLLVDKRVIDHDVYYAASTIDFWLARLEKFGIDLLVEWDGYIDSCEDLPIEFCVEFMTYEKEVEFLKPGDWIGRMIEYDLSNEEGLYLSSVYNQLPMIEPAVMAHHFYLKQRVESWQRNQINKAKAIIGTKVGVVVKPSWCNDSLWEIWETNKMWRGAELIHEIAKALVYKFPHTEYFYVCMARDSVPLHILLSEAGYHSMLGVFSRAQIGDPASVELLFSEIAEAEKVTGKKPVLVDVQGRGTIYDYLLQEGYNGACCFGVSSKPEECRYPLLIADPKMGKKAIKYVEKLPQSNGRAEGVYSSGFNLDETLIAWGTRDPNAMGGQELSDHEILVLRALFMQSLGVSPVHAGMNGWNYSQRMYGISPLIPTSEEDIKIAYWSGHRDSIRKLGVLTQFETNTSRGSLNHIARKGWEEACFSATGVRPVYGVTASYFEAVTDQYGDNAVLIKPSKRLAPYITTSGADSLGVDACYVEMYIGSSLSVWGSYQEVQIHTLIHEGMEEVEI